MTTEKRLPDYLKDVYYIGLGTASLLEDKTSQLFNDLIKEGEKSEKRWKDSIDSYTSKWRERHDQIHKNIEEQYSKTIKKLGLEQNIEQLRKNMDTVVQRVRKVVINDKPDETTATIETETTPTTEPTT